MRWGALGSIGVVVALSALVAATPVEARGGPDPSDVAVAVLRQVCDLQWVEGICGATGYPDPQYRTGTDPSPGQPLVQRVGAVHEHSGYSDGDPTTRPADYFAAGREGHNRSDDGVADTGVVLDFVLSSEHSENEKLPITTAEACINPDGIPDAIAELELEGIVPPLSCSNVDQPDHYRKWDETLAQAIEATDERFTALRGFEWTNDYFNHLGVYFSRNVVNAKVDGSYLTMDRFWDWLREPSERGGGDDALVVFNHPGGLPALSPFDGDLPHNQILADTLGGENWNDLAYVPDVDGRVAGIEVNGGDDLSWYLTALRNGWHLGPVAAEDEHQQEWSTSADGKTLVLTRGRSPRDYYFALEHHRTVAISQALVQGAPGGAAIVPSISWYADGSDLQDPAARPLGSVVEGGTSHALHLEADGLPPGAPVVVLSNALGRPEPLGTVAADGGLVAERTVTTPAQGEQWWLVVVCPTGTTSCGTTEAYDAVTAPIWFRAAPARPAAPATPAAVAEHDAAEHDAAEHDAAEPTAASAGADRLPATGGGGAPAWTLSAVLLALLWRARSHPRGQPS